MLEQGSVDKTLSRRDFLKLITAAGVAISFIPFVPWGKFMPNPENVTILQKAKVILPDGTHANVNTFPVNYADAVTYPSTGDRVLDEESFRKWNLIRLPAELGGSINDVSAFRLYSMVCASVVFVEVSPNYRSYKTAKQRRMSMSRKYI